MNPPLRLAHLPSGKGKVAVDRLTAVDALSADSTYDSAFTDEVPGTVKKTNLTFRWLLFDPGTLARLAKSSRSFEAKTVHVVVYDIVDFSSLGLDGLASVVAELKRRVEGASGRSEY